MPVSRSRKQSGGSYNSLYGSNLPMFYDTSSPSYYSNNYGFSETQLRPFSSGHGTVGSGAGHGTNFGSHHYALPMSGAGSVEDVSVNDQSEDLELEVDDLSSVGSDDMASDDMAVDDISDDVTIDSDSDSEDIGDGVSDDDVEVTVDGEVYNLAGGGALNLPWEWFNPTGSPSSVVSGPSGFNQVLTGGRRRVK